MDLLEELAGSRVLSIIRGKTADAAIAAGKVLLEEGMRVVEVSLTTPGALQAIEALAAAAPPGAQVGAGTVLTAGNVDDAVAAGAQFIVTPALAESVHVAARRGLPVAAGALSPTEAWAAVQAGATVVKLFPASLGGPSYLRAVREPFPQIPFMAVGGVGLNEVAAYLEAGAVAVGVGGPLVGDAARGGSLDELRTRVRSFREVVG